jgi:hypothetical protein
MSLAWAPQPTNKSNELEQMGKPAFLSHLISDQEREGLVIDCSGEDCLREAEFWVSCGGLRQSLCGVCEFIAHATWHGRPSR